MIFGLAILSAMAPVEAMAAETISSKRQGCRVEQPQQKPQQAQQQQQQQRARAQDFCRDKRAIPPVVDPTPIFLL